MGESECIRLREILTACERRQQELEVENQALNEQVRESCHVKKAPPMSQRDDATLRASGLIGHAVLAAFMRARIEEAESPCEERCPLSERHAAQAVQAAQAAQATHALQVAQTAQGGHAIQAALEAAQAIHTAYSEQVAQTVPVLQVAQSLGSAVRTPTGSRPALDALGCGEWAVPHTQTTAFSQECSAAAEVTAAGTSGIYAGVRQTPGVPTGRTVMSARTATLSREPIGMSDIRSAVSPPVPADGGQSLEPENEAQDQEESSVGLDSFWTYRGLPEEMDPRVVRKERCRKPTPGLC